MRALTQTHTHAQTQTDKRDSGYNLQFTIFTLLPSFRLCFFTVKPVQRESSAMKPGVRYGSSPMLNNANHALNCPAHQWGIGGRHKYNAGLLRFTMPVKYTDEHNEKDCTELFFNIGQNTTEKICKEYIHNNTNFEIMRKRARTR